MAVSDGPYGLSNLLLPYSDDVDIACLSERELGYQIPLPFLISHW